MKDEIPAVTDISPTNCLDLDERISVEIFRGKDKKEAASLFCENPSYYVDYLHPMGAVAFRYYFLAYLDFLRSEKALKEPGCLQSFLTVIEVRCTHQSDMDMSFSGIKSDVVSCLEYINQNKASFDLDPNIYGDVFSKLGKWESRFRESE